MTDNDIPLPFDKDSPTPGRTDAWIVGFALAEQLFYDGAFPQGATHHTFQNPFKEGTEQHAGFEEGFQTFTQK